MSPHQLARALPLVLLQFAACSASPEPSAESEPTAGHPDAGPSFDSGTFSPPSTEAAAPSSVDAEVVDAAGKVDAAPDAGPQPCPGIQRRVAGQCVCPTNMEAKGSECVESFDAATKPADGWLWDKGSNASSMVGCSSSDTGGGCNGTGPWPDPACNYVIGGNVGWAIVDSPAPAGGKALREYSYANNNCCWQGDSIAKSYELGESVPVDKFELSFFVSVAGSGTVWQCGFIQISLMSEGEQVGTVTYSDGVHGSNSDCGNGGPVLPQQNGVATLDLASAIPGSSQASFDEIDIEFSAYSCGEGYTFASHSITIDDVTMGLAP